MSRPVITVRKLNHHGRELYRYQANLLELNDSYVKVEATFDLPDNRLDGLTFRTGDRFLEWHYRDRWYNVFAVHDGDSAELKGWYCNITRPAVYQQRVISADDLALDLVVLPDGAHEVLDQDEFKALDLGPNDRRQALSALEDLRASAARLTDPFFRE